MIRGPLVFAVYKPVDKTTFYLIKRAKPHLGKSNGKIGHFGTLDPFAEGLVLLGARGAMRLMNYIHTQTSKTYEAQGLIGVKTDTADLTGKIVATNSNEELAQGFERMQVELKHALSQMLGKYQQTPPAFSATKFEGKALYEYAREGVMIEKEAVERHIYGLELLDFHPPTLRFRCEVGTGTYVRTLFEDLCAKFGLYGHLTALKRTQIGDISLTEAISLDDLSLPLMEQKSIALTRLLDLPERTLSDVDSCRFLHGQRLRLEGEIHKLALVYSKERCLGLIDDQGQPKLVFPD